MYALYSMALGLVMLGYLPAFLARRLGRSYRGSLAQRFGALEPGLPAAPRCWIHAVSVGEATTAVPLVEGIRQRWPELGIVLTTVTPTGARIVGDRLAGMATHRYFPIDLPGPVNRALDAVRPRFFIAMETELWPNFLRAVAARGIPSMIANGRISDRSFRHYRRVRFLMGRVLGQVSVFAMQSAEDARRIIALGAPPDRVVVTGNLKTDLPAGPAEEREAWRLRLGAEAETAVWVAGSTHRGEDDVVLDVFHRLRRRFPRLILVLAPRHPERAAEVERAIRDRDLPWVRRTELAAGARPQPVLLLDTVGELVRLYAAADLVFVGGSLVPAGGHNMLEPALQRRPVLFGPHTTNFRESAELLVAAGGARVVEDGEELERAVTALLDRPEVRHRMGEAGFGAVSARQGAVRETLELVGRVLLGQTGR